MAELSRLANRNIDVLRGFLELRDIIVIGYNGWNDGLMAALCQCDSGRHTVYWCGVESNPPTHIADFLGERGEGAIYVKLDHGGADSLMRDLYELLIPEGLKRNPMQRKALPELRFPAADHP